MSSRETVSRAWKWKGNCEKIGGDRSQWPWKIYPPVDGLFGYGEGGLFSKAVENAPPPSTYPPSSTFEINEYYLINIIITSISMNRNLLNGYK